MSLEAIEKLDKLALDCTMVDESLGDLQAVVGLSTTVDELKAALGPIDPPALAMLFEGLSKIFEKFLLGDAGPDKGPDVIELINNSISITRDVLGGTSEPDNVTESVNSIFGAMKEKFDVALGEVPDSEPAKEKEVEKEPEGEKEGLRSILKLIDENDAVIFEGFLDESTDQVNKIEEYVIALDENPQDMDIINSLFRVFHSLKGAAGFLEMKEINHICHEAENLLDQARKSQMKVDSEFIDVVLAARDLLEKGLTSIDDVMKEGKNNLPNFSGEVEKLDIGPVMAMINHKLEVGDSEEKSDKLGEILLEKKLVSPEDLEKAVSAREKPIGEILVDMGATSKEGIGKALEVQQERKKLQVPSIKVDTKKLNLLLELVGELVISQAIVSENKVLEQEENVGLSKDIVEMAKITGGIQDQIMSLRMVPLRQTFQKMNRLIRDLSKKTDKRVRFEIYGEETEIDKTIVDQLNDPLVHLLRNSVDHGLETSEVRLKAGKHEEGKVTLGAYQKGGNVVIEIKDDGKGLDLEKIQAKAIDKGFIDPDKTYTDEEIKDLIFQPGLSTHAVATDISGRGVGMDVVKRNVTQLGGNIEIITEKGVGSTFLVKLPLTMAIIDGMLVRIGDERYIIPTVTINESIRPQKDQVSTVIQQGEVINVRGDLIPLIRLHELFGIQNGKKDIFEGLVIIVNTGKEKRGLLVDDLLGQQQVVVKNLDKRLKGLKAFSGSSILGDGLVGLILDVTGIFEKASS